MISRRVFEEAAELDEWMKARKLTDTAAHGQVRGDVLLRG